MATVRMTTDLIEEITKYAARALQDTYNNIELADDFWHRALKSSLARYEDWVKHSPPEFQQEVTRWQLQFDYHDEDGSESSASTTLSGTKRKFVVAAKSYYGADYGASLTVTDPDLIAEYEAFSHSRDRASLQLQEFHTRLQQQLQQFGTLNSCLKKLPELWNILSPELKERYNAKVEKKERAKPGDVVVDEGLARHINMAATMNTVLDSIKKKG